MKKLIVHIGCGKGGSSAIQRGLRLNVAALAEQDIVVPSSDLDPRSVVTGRHTEFFESLVERRAATDIPSLGDLLDAAAGDGASTLVLSAENLSNPTGFEKTFAKLKGRFDVFIVLYVRRQDEYLASSWQQWNVKEGHSLLSWVAKGVGIRGDWLRVVEPWAATFGDDHIIARIFDRERLVGGDVFLDFADVLDADAARLEAPGQENLGLSAVVSRLVERRGFLFDGPCDQAFYESLRELAPDHFQGNNDLPLFGSHEAKAILSRYRQSNEAFRRRYLPHLKGPLFAPVRGQGEGAATSPNVEALERGFLQRQIFGLHQQVAELRRLVVAPRPESRLRRWATFGRRG